MEEGLRPIGWPKNIQLPTKEEVEEEIQRGEEMIIKMQEDLKGKLDGPSSEMLNALITI
jgi:hypothetical protein